MINELDQEELNELYQSIVLQHSKNPHNFKIIDHNKSSHGKNPNCGDTIDVFLNVQDDKIEDISFQGEGCALCMSSASLITDKIKNMSTVDALKFIQDFYSFIKDNSPLDERFEPLHIYSHVKNFPLRVKCVLLSPKTIESAIRN